MTKKKLPSKKIDTHALLAQLDIVQVIDARVKLTKSGAEYQACCPFHNESTPSFKVSPSKQFYNCFGCGANGDAIKFVQEFDGLTFIDACRALGADVPDTPPDGQAQQASAQKRAKAAKPGDVGYPKTAPDENPLSVWRPVLPVPDNAAAPPCAHAVRGKPTATWAYRDVESRLLGFIFRFEKSNGGKEILPLTYCRNEKTKVEEWRWMSFPEPRPLYGLDRLAARPEATVLVVEGEKCAVAAHENLPDLVVVSWPGGGKAVDKVDWWPLAGRKVIGWADCDAKHERLTLQEKAAGIDQLSKPLLPSDKQPGVAAMNKVAAHVLMEGGRWWDVQIPVPGARLDGWDIVDFIDDLMPTADAPGFLANYIRENIVERKVTSQENESTSTKAGASVESNRPFIPGLVFSRGEIANCLSNVYQILAFDQRWRGVLAFDEMSLCTVKRKVPPFPEGRVGEWDTQDDSRSAMWLTREYGVAPSSAMVAEAVEVLARSNAWHPVKEYFRRVKWDKKKRLNFWLCEYLGVEHTPYSSRVGAWWIMGAVKRVLCPGAKFDYCLVLSGNQGKGKSTVFEILGGPWYGDTELDLQSKDAMSGLRGKLIYEFPELGALARSEERRQKSFLSRRIDEYRPVYGRREIKAPRQVVFGGSTNEHEWNKDPTGGRRFWNVDVLMAVIDISGLAAVRDQLFAEALFRVESGERYWPTAEEQREWFDIEQLRVETQDSMVDALHDWVYEQAKEFSAFNAAMSLKNMDPTKLTRDLQTRVGIALRKLGCARVERRNGMIRYWYKPPVRKEATSIIGQNGDQDLGEDHAQF